MSTHKHNMDDIIDIDKNKITLSDIEFISHDKLSKSEYIIKYHENLYSDILL